MKELKGFSVNACFISMFCLFLTVLSACSNSKAGGVPKSSDCYHNMIDELVPPTPEYKDIVEEYLGFLPNAVDFIHYESGDATEDFLLDKGTMQRIQNLSDSILEDHKSKLIDLMDSEYFEEMEIEKETFYDNGQTNELTKRGELEGFSRQIYVRYNKDGSIKSAGLGGTGFGGYSDGGHSKNEKFPYLVSFDENQNISLEVFGAGEHAYLILDLERSFNNGNSISYDFDLYNHAAYFRFWVRGDELEHRNMTLKSYCENATYEVKLSPNPDLSYIDGVQLTHYIDSTFGEFRYEDYVMFNTNNGDFEIFALDNWNTSPFNRDTSYSFRGSMKIGNERHSKNKERGVNELRVFPDEPRSSFHFPMSSPNFQIGYFSTSRGSRSLNKDFIIEGVEKEWKKTNDGTAIYLSTKTIYENGEVKEIIKYHPNGQIESKVD